VGHTNHYTYQEGDLTHAEWDALAAFSKQAAEAVEGTTCEVTHDYIDITGNPSCENLVLFKSSAHEERARYAALLGGRGFCKTNHHPYDAAVVAVLVAAQQIMLIDHWCSDGGPAGSRGGIELYYRLCDEFVLKHDRNWWVPPPKSHAKAAATFHAKWKESEPDLMNLAAAAQALAAIRGGSTTLVPLLEELNDILVDAFNLTSRPFNEDPEGVVTHGMLEAWRSELFDLVVTSKEC
jgi:hypothetical protein